MDFNGWLNEVYCGNCKHVGRERDFEEGCPICGYTGYYPVKERE